MSEIKNRFVITMTDGSRREMEAGSLEVGNAGQLKVQDVQWSVWNTFVSVREVIAPGLWAGYERQARDLGVNDE